jgi:ribosome modulation factor
VYDPVTRRLATIVTLTLLVPIVAGLLTLRSLDQKAAGEFLSIAPFFVALFAGVFLMIHLSTHVSISIDPMKRRISRIYKLFGYPVYRQAYDLSRFDRVSLHRAFRGGYQATLVGNDREVTLSASARLGWVRSAAEQAAIASGLKMSDQL